VFVLLLLALVPFLYISFFANPAADDYCNALWSIEKPFLDNYSYLFLSIGGRYTANILFLIHPLAFHSLTIYKLIPAFICRFPLLGELLPSKYFGVKNIVCKN